ncbi:MAG: diguanylate cyclase [Clostridiales Family XIII bacterium]|nr:diguanylate cyclase [Clostridiales Family XIII bacterium]
MSDSNTIQNASDEMFEFLRDMIYDPKKAELNTSSLPVELQDLGEGLVFVMSMVNEIRVFASDLSKGQLNGLFPSSENELAAPLKSLHATLRHLTWQAQQVAKGDYSQKVDFMGDFSIAFNSMTEQLDLHKKALIKENELKVRSLESIAYNDVLTGTYNRHYGMNILNEWTENKEHFCIVFIDMDKLKYVNDVLGHAEGDKYIISVARNLENFNPLGIICRLGGDEFMILVKDIDQATCEIQAEQIREKLKLDLDPEGRYKKSISYGVVEDNPDTVMSSGDLLSIADERMYEYKKAHKQERRDEM